MSDIYDLPTLVGGQYMLTSVLRETRDTVLYLATQKDLRREVIAELLRRSAAEHPRRVRLFLDSAKAQSNFQGDYLSSVLEVLEVNGTWMVVKESPKGEPLDMLLADGKRLSAYDLCYLMITLCHLCLRMDSEHVASTRFHLENVYYRQGHFRLSNPALAGTRSALSSRNFLADAARELRALLDEKSTMAGVLSLLFRRMSIHRDASPVATALFLAELTSLRTLALRESGRVRV